jgi:hypothetical protein
VVQPSPFADSSPVRPTLGNPAWLGETAAAVHLLELLSQ